MKNPKFEGPTESEVFRQHVVSATGFWLGSLAFVGIIIRHLIAAIIPSTLAKFFLCAALLLLVPILNRNPRMKGFSGILLLLGVSGLALISGFSNGGMRAPAVIILCMAPLIGLFAIGKFGAALSVAINAAIFSTLIFGEQQSWVQPIQHSDKHSLYMAVIYFLGSFVGLAIGAAYEYSRKKSEDLVRKLSSSADYAAKMASLGEISAGIAHEINNPLAIINGGCAVLIKGATLTEAQQEKIASIQRSCDRIAKIVSGLKKFSRSSEITPRGRHFLVPIIREAISLTEYKTTSTGASIVFEEKSNPMIACNEIEIEQVMINLINNALDAMKTSEKRSIRIDVGEDTLGAYIILADSGPGIPEKIREKIFEPFFTTKPLGEGTGLGLSISKGILDDHDASIALLPTSVGTCFKVAFKTLQST